MSFSQQRNGQIIRFHSNRVREIHHLWGRTVTGGFCIVSEWIENSWSNEIALISVADSCSGYADS